DVQLLPPLSRYEPEAVAVIGPHSTQLALTTTAAVLGFFLVPEISYEASLEVLNQKRLYPSLLHTVPSDGRHVRAILLLLQRFGWTWVALLGSDNAYGRDTCDTFYKLLAASDVCIAYRGTIPGDAGAGSPKLHGLLRTLTDVRVNVSIVFADKRSARALFEAAVQRNVTGMVWLGSDDWTVAPAVWQVPGIQSVGSVIGVVLQSTEPTMLERFESWELAEDRAAAAGAQGSEAEGDDAQPDCGQCCSGCHALTAAPDANDAQAVFSVYSAVYAVAHGLHDLLGCASGACTKGRVYPWQLLQRIKRVNFTLHTSPISFDASGAIRKGYDIIAWNWSGPRWAASVIGTFRADPDRLSIEQDKILWHTKDRQAPPSLCSQHCRPGQRRLQQSRHRCCFTCVTCPPGTFLNTSDLYNCQSCGADEWSPAGSEACFNRTVEFLSWSEPVSWVLLSVTALLLALLAALAGLFALHASTPVVKSAGGSTCFLMLAALACAGGSLLCNFGEPTRQTCLLRVPLFTVSVSVCLSCVATRSFQILCIFKLHARWPALLDAWQRRRGPLLFVAGSTAVQAALCLAVEAAEPSTPRGDSAVAVGRVLLECGTGGGTAAATAYTLLLSAGCFGLGYAGKDLPASYSEAKCLTCGLLLHLAGSAATLCTQGAVRGRAAAAGRVLGGLCTLVGLLGGYFVPKAFVILLRPQLNTAEHFQMAIQRYTRRCAA
ncbi:TS1R1 protein, partial [Urocolius indicus]|nr:TS1R1 protein [Urocolius indicus]